MKKTFFIAILFLALAVSAYAQDIIVLINGNIIEAKILEILPTEIRYRRFDNLNGPIHVIFKSEVYSIKYENGVVDVINAPVTTGQKPPNQTSPEYNPNKLYTSFSFDPSGFLAGGPSAKMEFAKGSSLSSFHVAFPSWAANSKAEGFGFGLGGSLNHIWNKGLGGFYLGGLFEWNVYPYLATISNPYGKYNPATDSFSKTNVIEKVTAHNFIIALNTGYRFVSSSGMYLRTGIAMGFTLSTIIPAEFYFKPDIAAGYVWGANSGSAANSGGGYNTATAAQQNTEITALAGSEPPFKVDISKLLTLKINPDSDVETTLKGNYQTIQGVKNEAPLRLYSDVLIFLPREALPPNFSLYKRLTITCKYYDAAGAEIPQGDASVVMIYDVKGKLRGPVQGNGRNLNTPFKESVGGPSGTINKDSGINITFDKPPQAIMFQNTTSNVAFIELTSLVFHNGNYKSK